MKKSFGPKLIAMPSPVWVICTYDDREQPNGMTAAWCGVCCSKPPSICVAIRESRHTYNSIVERQAFTVNIPNADQVAVTDYFGITSGRNDRKFTRAGLTAIRADTVDAPFIAEFPIALECRLTGQHDIGAHVLFIGEVLESKCEQRLLNSKGNPDLSLVQPFVFSPADGTYYEIRKPLGQAYDLGSKLADEPE